MEDPDLIVQRLESVRERVDAACRTAGREPATVGLIAVSKRHPVAAIRRLYDAGHRDFGENHASELADKAGQLPGDIRWHLIGPVQRRAVNRLPGRGVLLHTLDRVELLERWLRVHGVLPPALVQVKLGDEISKSGVRPGDLQRFVEDLGQAWPQLELRGLMTIPPPAERPEDARRWFATLRGLGEDFAGWTGRPAELSMGMSDDFEVAVAEGSHWLRVGTAIFGSRPDAVQ